VGPLPTVLTANDFGIGGDLVATGALPLLLVPTPATKKINRSAAGTNHHGVFDRIIAAVFPGTFAAIEGAQCVQDASLVLFGALLPFRDGFYRHCYGSVLAKWKG